jgi:hypothetical protein
MTTDEFFQAVREAYAAATWDEDFPPLADLDDTGMDGLDELVNRLLVLKQTVDRMRGQVETEIAHRVGVKGAARVGEIVYRYKPKATMRIIDPQGLVDWLGEDWHHVIPVTRSTSIRKGGMSAVCEKREADPRTIEDTFFEWEEGAPTVDRIPLDKAPKFLQRLGDGEILRGSDDAAA